MLFHYEFSQSCVSFTEHLNSIICFPAAEKWSGGSSHGGRWPHGPVAKMYHSVVSWIIEQQNCNFRDQCSVSTLFPFQSEQLIIHICCAFRLQCKSLLTLKVFSKENRSLDRNQKHVMLMMLLHCFFFFFFTLIHCSFVNKYQNTLILCNIESTEALSLELFLFVLFLFVNAQTQYAQYFQSADLFYILLELASNHSKLAK